MEQAKVTSLTPNPWNTNGLTRDAEAKLDQSLRRNGLFKPIVVRETGDGRLQIIGGQHRWESACRLGFETVPIHNLGPIDDRKAKEISIVDNARYGTDDVIPLAELLRDIGEPDLLLEFLPMQASDLEAMRKAIDIDLDAIGKHFDEDDDTPVNTTAKPVKTHAVMRFSVPVANQPFIERIVTDIIKHKGFSDPDAQINAGEALMEIVRFWDDGGGR